MTEMTMTKTQLINGVWHAELKGVPKGVTPQLSVTHRGEPVAGLTQQQHSDGDWTVNVPVPTDRLADGMQTFVISDAASGDVLASFALLSGEALAEDIRAEMDLLRDELDMLKRAFRRHCLETASTDA